MRCDVNVSVRPAGQEQLGTKVEVKNMNSFSGMTKAIDFEVERQVRLVSQRSLIPNLNGTEWWEPQHSRALLWCALVDGGGQRRQGWHTHRLSCPPADPTTTATAVHQNPPSIICMYSIVALSLPHPYLTHFCELSHTSCGSGLRQVALHAAGRADEILPETRGWDEAAQVTRGQRSKEGLADYRYFPEPDLPPLHITPQYLQSVQVFR
jgi:GatB/GatE catalytic domain